MVTKRVTRKPRQPRWLNADSFEDALLASGSPLDSTACCVTFVIGKDCKPLLEALARLLAICNQLVSSGKSVQGFLCIHVLSDPGYLNRIGFIDLLHEYVQILPKRPKAPRLQPTKVTTMCW